MPQVTAELLSERLGGRVWAKRYAPGGHTWAKHLADAQDAGNPLHGLLGAGGTLEYDYVIFQVLRIVYFEEQGHDARAG